MGSFSLLTREILASVTSLPEPPPLYQILIASRPHALPLNGFVFEGITPGSARPDGFPTTQNGFVFAEGQLRMSAQERQRQNPSLRSRLSVITRPCITEKTMIRVES
jgi:hypothetical protein